MYVIMTQFADLCRYVWPTILTTNCTPRYKNPIRFCSCVLCDTYDSLYPFDMSAFIIPVESCSFVPYLTVQHCPLISSYRIGHSVERSLVYMMPYCLAAFEMSLVPSKYQIWYHLFASWSNKLHRTFLESKNQQTKKTRWICNIITRKIWWFMLRYTYITAAEQITYMKSTRSLAQ